MARDYVHRPQRTRAQAAPTMRFHWTSFGGGVAIGVALTVATVTAPQWWTSADASPQKAEVALRSADPTRFEFYDRLPRAEVNTDPASYGEPIRPREASKPAPAEGAPSEFVLQAGSFSKREDADRLRGGLEEMGFKSSTHTVRFGDGLERHRVLVGPFATEVEVHRALTQLRERDIDALLMARKPG